MRFVAAMLLSGISTAGLLAAFTFAVASFQVGRRALGLAFTVSVLAILAAVAWPVMHP